MELDRTLTIYKASAGSGKTYTLALEYIKLLLGVKNAETGSYSLNDEKYCGRRLKNRHRHILAITFTNKATAEMKERIVKQLHSLAVMPSPGAKDADYAPALTAAFGCTRAELCRAASMAMNELLYDYSGFNVSTIDSFFQLVLREFAREVDRQGDFEVELDDNAVVSNGVSMMLDDLNYGNPPDGPRMQRWIYDYMLNRIRESGKHYMLDRGSGVFASLVDFVGKSCSEDYKEYAPELQRYLDEPGNTVKFRAVLARRIKDAAEELQKAARAVKAVLMQAECDDNKLNRYLLKYVDESLAGKEPSDDSLNTKVMQSLIDESYTDEKIYAKGKCTTGSGKNKITVYPPSEVASALQVFACAYEKMCVERAVCRPTLKAVDNLEFLGFVMRYIEQFRRENNLILLSDTNDLLSRIISDDDAPFIYERLGMFLHHYLIDEFQDTSRMQWNNLRPLVAEGVHNRHDSLIIGDEKQAIYRFRNSDSSMLHSTVSEVDFPGRNRVKGDAPGDNTNRRSAPDMVRFNNTLFGRMAAGLGVPGFENVVQTLPPCDGHEDSAYIRFAKVSDTDEALADMASHMLRQHEAGYRWRDIAVLVRGTAEAAKVVEFLRTQHPEISVLSEEALYLHNSTSVKLIIGMLKLLDRSYADENGSTGSRTLSDTMAMISRFDYYKSEGAAATEALSAALGDISGSEAVSHAVSHLRSLHASSLSSLVEMIVQQRIPAAQRKHEMAFICAFQDMVTDYCKRYPDSIHDFVKWYYKVGRYRSLPAAPDIDAVPVMTIHKSKGLEWPCVHIPMAQWALCREDDVWFHPHFPGISSDITPPIILVPTTGLFGNRLSPYRIEYEREKVEQRTDNLNITYVAFTRAGRELIISSSGASVGKDIELALRRPATDGELADGLHIDTAAAFTGDCLMEIGQPTEPSDRDLKRQKEHSRRSTFELDDYEVFDRDDTRELVAMPDITTELGAISDDDPADIAAREIVDPIPSGCSGEELRQRAEAARRGTLLHAVMAEMETRSDLEYALGRVANAVALAPDETELLRRLLQTALDSDDPRVDRWFDSDGRLLSEQSIMLTDGTVLRPDRIVIHSDGSVDLVDYKFTSEMRLSHQQQLRDYCLMLRNMGYKRVSGHLWYPLLGKIATEKIEN